jgi:hypothetical protein
LPGFTALSAFAFYGANCQAVLAPGAAIETAECGLSGYAINNAGGFGEL